MKSTLGGLKVFTNDTICIDCFTLIIVLVGVYCHTAVTRYKYSAIGYEIHKREKDFKSTCSEKDNYLYFLHFKDRSPPYAVCATVTASVSSLLIIHCLYDAHCFKYPSHTGSLLAEKDLT